jgi:hypothetical protein
MSLDIKDAADFPSLVSVSSERLQQLELFEVRAELDTRTVAGQQQEIQKLQEALAVERAHNARYSDIVATSLQPKGRCDTRRLSRA